MRQPKVNPHPRPLWQERQRAERRAAAARAERAEHRAASQKIPYAGKEPDVVERPLPIINRLEQILAEVPPRRAAVIASLLQGRAAARLAAQEAESDSVTYS